MNPVGFTKAWIPKKIGVDKIGAYEVTPPRSARSQGRSQRAALGFRGQKWCFFSWGGQHDFKGFNQPFNDI